MADVFDPCSLGSEVSQDKLRSFVHLLRRWRCLALGLLIGWCESHGTDTDHRYRYVLVAGVTV